MRLFKSIFELIKLELKMELRTKYALAGSVLYVITTVFVLYTSVQNEDQLPWNALFWLMALFISINAITKSFSSAANGSNLYLYQLASPVEVLLAKTVYNFLLVFSLLMLSFGVFSLFIENPIQHFNVFAISLALGALGISSVLTFISSISSKTDNGSVFMAILGFPLIIPIFLSLIKLSENALKEDMNEYFNDILVLSALDAIIFGTSLILFPFLWRE